MMSVDLQWVVFQICTDFNLLFRDIIKIFNFLSLYYINESHI